MSITSWTAAGGDWNDAQYQRAWDGPAISPTKGDLTLSSSVPSFGQEFFASPGVANLEIVQSYEWDQLTSSWVDSTGDWNSGPTPQMAVGTTVSVDKANLTFTAYAPDTGIFYKFVITAPTLTLTGYAPIDGTGFVLNFNWKFSSFGFGVLRSAYLYSVVFVFYSILFYSLIASFIVFLILSCFSQKNGEKDV